MGDSLLYKLNSGKPFKLWYLIKCYLSLLIPRCLYRFRREALLKKAEKREDYSYILDRVDYYCKLSNPKPLPEKAVHDHLGYMYRFVDKWTKFHPKTFHKVYFFDLYEVMRYFSTSLRVSYLPGDVYITPEFPTIVKSRLLSENNENSVLLKLNKHRHFVFVNDTKPFCKKTPKAIFRGRIRRSRQREQFMQMYFGTDFCDCGIVGRNDEYPKEWITPKKTIREHLDYQYVIALEGNDVATNLKWVMSSNSIAVMTRPTCETWFMEGKLIPDYHYIEIKDDLSDLKEKMDYYSTHPDKAQQIIEHAHEHVKQFLNTEREKLISLMVAKKYFLKTSVTYH